MQPVQCLLVDCSGEITAETLLAAPVARGVSGHMRAIQSAGAVEWLASGQRLRLSFRPAITTTRARDRVLEWLDYQPGPTVHLRYWAEGEWRHEIAGSPRSSARRLADLVSAFGGGLRSRVCQQRTSERDIHRLRPHRSALAFWKEQRDRLDPRFAMPVLQQLSGGRTTLVRLDDCHGFVVETLGPNLSLTVRNWADQGPRRIAELPDPEYARALHERYTEASAALAPIGDVFDGLMKLPGRPHSRYGYHRLVLPFRSGGSTWLATSTIMDPDLDLMP